MEWNYSKLSGKIVEKFKTRKRFAAELGMSCPTLCSRLLSRSEFTQDEILKATNLLEIDQSEIPLYFFTRKV